MCRVLLAIACALPMAAAAPVQRIPSVTDAMRRVAAYVDAYGEKASIVVATEHYTQQARTERTDAPRERRLVADFAIVKVMRRWQGFRDVVEVDGAAVADRDDRLVRLLTQPGGGYDEARRLSDESARFNIGAIQRNFNVPTTALFFFRLEDLDRFTFSAKGVDDAGVWEIAFRERSRPTLIRTPRGESIPSKGSLWVNPQDGTVVRTLLEVEGFSGRRRSDTRASGRVDVIYRRVPELDMWLPASMDENFGVTSRDESEHISGRALYSNYRQFQTAVRIK